MTKLVSYFFSDYHFKTQTLWFKRLLYLLLIIKSWYWLSRYDVLFGSNSIVYKHSQSIGSFRDLAFSLYNSHSLFAGYFFILPIIVISCYLFIFSKTFIITDFILWLLIVNIHTNIYPSLTGGDYLLNQLLFFNSFLSFSFFNTDKWQTTFKKCIHNLAVIAILCQICMVYFLSSITKLDDENWRNGTAIYQVSQTDQFSLPIFKGLSKTNIIFCILNYLVLVYQLLFPILIWIKKIKIPFLIFGIGMHLYIAFIMGLVEFSAIMIICYVYFWPFIDKESQEIKHT